MCIRDRCGGKTFSALAKPLFKLKIAGGAAEIGRRPADVVYVSLKTGIIQKAFGFVYDRLLASAGYKTSLVKGKRTEIAGAETAAIVDVYKRQVQSRPDGYSP